MIPEFRETIDKEAKEKLKWLLNNPNSWLDQFLTIYANCRKLKLSHDDSKDVAFDQTRQFLEPEF